MKSWLKPSLCLLLALFLFNHLRSQMRQIHVEPTEGSITKLSFYSPAEGYLGLNSSIAFTSDSGRTWTKKEITYYNVDFNGYSNVNLTFGFGVSGVKAFDRNRLIIYGDYGWVPAILYSENGGQTFKLVFHSQFILNRFATGVTDMSMAGSSTTGFAVDADRILKTADRGLTWNIVRSDLDSYFDGVQAVDISNVCAWSTDRLSRKLVKSSDGGYTWQSLNIPKGVIGSCYFTSPTKGWVSVYDADVDAYNLYTTVNGGASWTLINHPQGSPFGSNKMVFVNDTLGYALTNLYTVSQTTDGGKVWEDIPRDNSFLYLGYTHNDLQVWSKDQLWAGGGHGFLELNTNATGITIPRAQFVIDTSGVSQSGIVQLVNYSKTGYQYHWYRNSTLISSDFNASYSHDPSNRSDTIKLVVTNGTYSDTLIETMYFNPPVTMSSFTPTTGVYSTVVTISGSNFVNVQQVSFGGVPANSFTVVSSSQIRAVVGSGATGAVTVKLYNGENGSKPGFVFLPPPTIDLPYSISDTILCKSESISVYIQNTEAGVRYELMDADRNYVSFGGVDSRGGTAVLTTSPISVSGEFRLKATRIGYNSYNFFTQKFGVKVEHTKSSFIASKINILPNEKVVFGETSYDASTYQWTFEGGANNSYSNLSTPEVFYTTEGQKSLTLISTSANGCSDTLDATAVTVYNRSNTDDVCYLNTLDAISNGATLLQHFVPDHNAGFISTSRIATTTRLNSRYGTSAKVDTSGRCISDYTSNGVLRWMNFMKAGEGNLFNATTDDQGNIYILGTIRSTHYFHYNATDSMRFYVQAADTTYLGEKMNGFILKLDSNRKYVWHSVFYDPTRPYSGYPYTDAYATKIVIKGQDILLECDFSYKLYYAHNNVLQQLLDFPVTTAYNLQSCVVKIKTDGTLAWFARVDNHYVNAYSFDDLKMDEQGNVYLAGSYENSVQIYDATGAQKASLAGGTAEFRSYVARFDARGNFKWVNKISTTYVSDGYYGSFTGDTYLSALATDGSGNCYLTGKVLQWNSSGQLRIEHSNGAVSYDSINGFMLVKFDSVGHRIWVAGSRYPYAGEGQGIALKSDTVYVFAVIHAADTVSNKLCFIPENPGYPYMPAGGPYLLRYDTSGILKRAVYGGYDPEYGDHFLAKDMFLDRNNNFIIGGNARGSSPIFGVALPYRMYYSGAFLKLDPGFCLGNVVPVAEAGPDRTICAGDSAVIGSTAAAGNNYHWVSNQGSFASTKASLAVYPKVTTTYYLTAMSGAGVLSRDSVIVNVKATPVANAGLDETICTGTSVTLGTPAITGNSYTWSSSPAGMSSSLAQITVSPATRTSYYLSVSANGCTGRDTVVITVTSALLPAVSITASNTSVCAGSVVNFTSTAQNGGRTPSYQWQVNGQNIGSDSSSFSRSTFVNGDRVNLMMTSSLSCANPKLVSSNYIFVNVASLPVANAGPEVIVCRGSANGLQLGAAPASGTVYSWVPSTGLSASNVAQPIANPQATTTYYLQATALNGCKANDTVTVTVQATQPPTITANGNVLSSSASLGNQWSLNASPINGATSQTYLAVATGLYTATVTENGCTSSSSNAINYVVTAITDPQLDNSISLAPNPVRDELNIKYNGNNSRFTIVMTDETGKLMAKGSFRTSFKIEMKGYTAGVYMVQIINERTGAHVQRKIIKI